MDKSLLFKFLFFFFFKSQNKKILNFLIHQILHNGAETTSENPENPHHLSSGKNSWCYIHFSTFICNNMHVTNDMIYHPTVDVIWFYFLEKYICIIYTVIRNFPPKCPTAFPSLSLCIHQYMIVLAQNKKKNGLNKVQSDSRLWDLQTNRALVPWGPGSGINCYISWPLSCCLSQPAWQGSGLARNHGLQTQQYGHFTLQKKKKKEKITGFERFTEQTRQVVPNTSGSHISQSLFRLPFFFSLALPIGGAEKLVDLFCKLWRWLT